VAASTLTKVGETDLAWIAADRGLVAAQDSNDDVIIGSLFRSVVHALLANGKYADAVRLTKDVGERLDRKPRHADTRRALGLRDAFPSRINGSVTSG
jgi:hypothetical protein